MVITNEKCDELNFFASLEVVLVVSVECISEELYIMNLILMVTLLMVTGNDLRKVGVVPGEWL